MGTFDAPFGYAEGFDQITSEYAGLIYAKAARKSSPRKGSLFAPTLRSSKYRACRPLRPVRSPEGTAPRVRPDLLPARQALPPTPIKPRRFYGSVEIDINRPVKAIDPILYTVVMELQRSPGAKVKLTLEIEAEASSGFNDADASWCTTTTRGS